MNYGKKSVKQKKKALQSTSSKLGRKCLLTFSKVLLLCVIAIGIIGICAGLGVFKGIIDSAPTITLEDATPTRYSSFIYDSKGNQMAKLIAEDSNRVPVTMDQIPTDLANAFVAIEDERFYQHNGIDIMGILRAGVTAVKTGFKRQEGASTITQQLIKNTVLTTWTQEKTLGERIKRKVQEQYLAIQLEKDTNDKSKILEQYMNTINLGQNTLGVQAASKRYFNKNVWELSLSECATIAGITQNPSRFNPLSENGRKRNEEKRRVILQYMYEQGMISKDDQEEALADDVYSRIKNVDIVTKETQTPYSYFTDELIDQVLKALQDKKGYTETQAYNLLFSGGLEIHTTQDPDIQSVVDEEISRPENYDVVYYSIDYRLSIQHPDQTTTNYSDETLKTYFRKELGETNFDGLFSSKEKADKAIAKYKAAVTKDGDTVLGESVHYVLQPQASFVLIDQSSGYVKALSGGRGQKEVSRSLNRATNTLRQPGSTFKVITSFAPAIDTCGATLGSVYYDGPYTMGTKTFRNWYSSKGYMGYSTIRDGIVYSMNIVAVRCMIETVTPQLGVEYARNLGITSLTDTDYNASTALGGITKGVSNLELTNAFAAIANGGIYTKPVFFTQILDHNGKVLLENAPETKRVLKDSTAFLLTDAMSQSMESSRMFASSGVSLNSTSAAANIPGMSNAGKSGTTTNNNDIWFVGFTPYYTAGIWSGCDDNQKISAVGSSTSYHKKIWKAIMTKIHEGLADTGFPVPSSVTTAQICRKSGKLAIPGVCENDPRGNAVYTEYFAKGTVPTEVCDHHVQLTVCSESGGLATEYCPAKTTRTFMVIPDGESGGTDDSKYRSPGTCTIHSSTSVVLPSEEDTENMGSTKVETVPETVPETTKAAPKSPLDQVYIPVGPGYN